MLRSLTTRGGLLVALWGASAAAAPCPPAAGREAALADHPEALLACSARDGAPAAVWRAHALATLGRFAEAADAYPAAAKAPRLAAVAPVLALAALRARVHVAPVPPGAARVPANAPRWLRAEWLATAADLAFARGDFS